VSELSELHRDALSELFNLGVGRAAHSLSQMVRDEIELSAPFVDVIQAHEVSAVLIGSEFRELSMVTIDFEGPFVSKAILLFPERNALAILSNMLDPDLTPEEVSEFEQEAMCEIGNVILNACMSARSPTNSASSCTAVCPSIISATPIHCRSSSAATPSNGFSCFRSSSPCVSN
jgi:Chemotaxis protein CheC, inhibitor of MCP methylation